jgi:hypothetical protein
MLSGGRRVHRPYGESTEALVVLLRQRSPSQDQPAILQIGAVRQVSVLKLGSWCVTGPSWWRYAPD